MSGAAAVAYERLRKAITEGTLSGGTRLKETELAERLGVSRTPIREAIRRLHSDGLVELHHNRGAIVPHWTSDDLNQSYALRALLEGYGARLAAINATEEDLAQLREVAGQMASLTGETTEELDKIQGLNRVFHDAILRAGGDRRLTDMVTSLAEVSIVRRTFRQYSQVELERSMHHHAELVEAIGEGDANWAESVMRAHVQAARAALSRDRQARSGSSDPRIEEDAATPNV